MRRQDKYIINATLGVAAITALLDVLLQKEELKKNGQKLTLNNYDGIQTLRRMTFFGIAGGFIGNEIYKLEFQEEIKKPFSNDNFLKKLLQEENINSNRKKLKELKSITAEVKDILNEELSGQLVNYPEDIGSLRKKTAIASTYDSDIVLPIKKENQFGTLSNMSNGIHNIIDDKFGKLAKVTKLKKATSLSFIGEEGIHKVDIIYGREIDNYTTDKKLNLYVRPYYFWQNGTSFKTDIGIQTNLLVNKPKVREVIQALKIYRDRNNLALENIIIDQLALDALSPNNYGRGIPTSENLEKCLDHIAIKFTNTKILDYANSNNNFLGKIDYPSRQNVLNRINKDLSKIKSNPHYIKEIFHL